MDDPIKILSERLATVLTEWHLAGANQFEAYKGRLEEIQDILKSGKVTESELSGGLESADFTALLASKLLGGNRGTGK